MGLGHNDPWVESHIRPQQMWGQRSSGVNDLWFKFLQKISLYPHTFMYVQARLVVPEPLVMLLRLWYPKGILSFRLFVCFFMKPVETFFFRSFFLRLNLFSVLLSILYIHISQTIKGVLHPWALFLKTLCIFSKNKATSDKVSHGSGQKCSKELKNHSFTLVETIVVKLQ